MAEDPRLASWPAMPLAVVVGAGAMGMAIARRLGQQHRLILAEKQDQRLEAATAALWSEGIRVLPVVCDVTQERAVQALAQEVSSHGPMRTLAHVAGLSPSMADWRTIMTVNLVGPTRVADALLPLVTQGSAAIFIASLAAHIAVPEPKVMQVLDEPLEPGFLDALVEVLGQEPSTQQSYHLSKAALVRLCQRRASAWGQRHARIVSLSPGLIATPMGALEFRNPFKYELLAKTPLQRQGGMPEIADAVEFLASDHASFISGIDLLVDGGLNAASRFQHERVPTSAFPRPVETPMSAVINAPQPNSTFEPFSQEFRADPAAWHAELLRTSPAFIAPENYPSAFVATYAQTQAVLRDSARFSSVKPKNLPGMERVDFFNGMPVMNYSDPPDHTRLRRVVVPAFTPRRIQETSEATARFIEDLLAPIGSNQTMDAVNEVCKPLSIRLLLGHFLGVEPQDQPIFLHYISTLYLLDKLRPGEPKPKAFLDAWAAGEAYCRKALEDTKRKGTQNLIGLIAAAQDGGTMSDAEMMAMLVVLFSGGISTVAGAASSSLYHLAANPDIAERIRKDPALASRHLEESLRMDPPVTLVMRFAVEDVEIGDKVIRQGMPVYTMISVACRDPAEFPDPGRFDIDRINTRHLSFGFGIHVCIGNTITRTVVPMLVRAVASRYPNLRVDPAASLTWETSPRSRHMKTAPLLT